MVQRPTGTPCQSPPSFRRPPAGPDSSASSWRSRSVGRGIPLIHKGLRPHLPPRSCAWPRSMPSVRCPGSPSRRGKRGRRHVRLRGPAPPWGVPPESPASMRARRRLVLTIAIDHPPVLELSLDQPDPAAVAALERISGLSELPPLEAAARLAELLAIEPLGTRFFRQFRQHLRAVSGRDAGRALTPSTAVPLPCCNSRACSSSTSCRARGGSMAAATSSRGRWTSASAGAARFTATCCGPSSSAR